MIIAKKTGDMKTIFVLLIMLRFSSGKPGPETRIVGGIPAREGEFPFAAWILVKTPTAQFTCGGTLLSRHWILTAGFCVSGAVSFSIKLGSIYLDGTGNDDGIVTLISKDYILHEKFNASTLDHNIGVIRIDYQNDYTYYLKNVDYLPSAPLEEYREAFAVGWGHTADENGKDSDVLNSVIVDVIPNSECRKTYGNQISNNMVCVSSSFNGGTCLGDSGNALVQAVGRGYWVLVGVANFISPRGCESPDPSGFTRVFEYTDWIFNTTGRLL